MSAYADKISRAKESGYSDAEIADFLSKKDPDFASKYEKARSTGYSDEQIFNFISKEKEPQTKKEGLLKRIGKGSQSLTGSEAKEGIGNFVQIPLGLLSKLTAPLDLAAGANQQELGELYSEMIGEPGYEEYLQGKTPQQLAQEAFESPNRGFGGYLPTQGEAERLLAEKTGVDVRAQTPLQKMLRLGSQTKGLGGGNVASATAPISSQALQQLGFSEQIADELAMSSHILGPQLFGGKPSGYVRADLEGPSPKPQALGVQEPVTIKHATGRVESPQAPPPPPPPPPPEPPLKKIDLSLGKFLNNEGRFKSPYAEGEAINNRLNWLERSRGEGPTQGQTSAALDRSIGQVVYPDRTVLPPHELGVEGQNVLRAGEDASWRQVNRNYDDSRSLSRSMIAPRPVLSQALPTLINSLRSPEQAALLSPTEQSIVDIAGDLIPQLYDPETGQLREVSQQELIDVVQSINRLQRKAVDIRDEKNKFVLLKRLLEESIDEVYSEYGEEGELAREAWDVARQSRRTHAELYQNPEVYQWIRPDQRRYDSLAKQYASPSLIKALETTTSTIPGGANFLDQLKRNFTEDKLRSYIQKPSNVTDKGTDIIKDLAEVSSILTPEQMREITDLLIQANQTPTRQPLKVRTPEEMTKYMSTLSGLRDVESRLRYTPGGQDFIERLRESRMADILTEGTFNNKVDHKKMASVFNNRAKFAYIEHLIGEDQSIVIRDLLNEMVRLEEEPNQTPDIKRQKHIIEDVLDASLSVRTIEKLLSGHFVSAILGVGRKVFAKQVKGRQEELKVKLRVKPEPEEH